MPNDSSIKRCGVVQQKQQEQVADLVLDRERQRISQLRQRPSEEVFILLGNAVGVAIHDLRHVIAFRNQYIGRHHLGQERVEVVRRFVHPTDNAHDSPKQRVADVVQHLLAPLPELPPVSGHLVNADGIGPQYAAQDKRALKPSIAYYVEKYTLSAVDCEAGCLQVFTQPL